MVELACRCGAAGPLARWAGRASRESRILVPGSPDSCEGER